MGKGSNFTTNTELEFKEAYHIYSMRRSLEVVFKDSKGNLGLGKYQVRNFTSQIARGMQEIEALKNEIKNI